MPCPDDLTRDLWLVGALPSDKAVRLTDHVAECPTCGASARATRQVDQALVTALALDAAELAYLGGLNLTRRWQAAALPILWWSWLAFLATLATFAIWSFAGPVAQAALEILLRTGLGVILGRTLLATLSQVDHTLLALAASPLIAYSLPLLALLGLVLFAWPPRPEQVSVPTR